METACRFSIIVPVYNVEKYLKKCVKSLKEQDFENYEIILVDDGSADGSAQICDELAKNAESKIKVIHEKNKGLAAARNCGLKKAKGEYILFVDADDYVEHDFCRELDQILRKHENPEIAVYGGTEEDGKNKKERNPSEIKEKMELSGRDYLLLCYKENHLSNAVWTYAYKREFLEGYGLEFVEGILHEDVEFIPRVLLQAKRLIRADIRPYHYCIRPNSISTQRHKDKNIKDLFWVLEQQQQLAEQQEPELRRWMKNGILNSYLNMIQEARIYRPEYRKYFRKSFMWGKAATLWNHFRVVLCTISPRLYCEVNDIYKGLRE